MTFASIKQQIEIARLLEIHCKLVDGRATFSDGFNDRVIAQMVNETFPDMPPITHNHVANVRKQVVGLRHGAGVGPLLDKDGLTKTSLKIKVDLLDKLKMAAEARDVNVYELVEAAIERYLSLPVIPAPPPSPANPDDIVCQLIDKVDTIEKRARTSDIDLAARIARCEQRITALERRPQWEPPTSGNFRETQTSLPIIGNGKEKK